MMARLNLFEQSRLSQLKIALKNFESEIGMSTRTMLDKLQAGELELNGTFLIWRDYAETVERLEKKKKS